MRVDINNAWYNVVGKELQGSFFNTQKGEINMIKNISKIALDISNTGISELDDPINALINLMVNLCIPVGVILLIIAGMVFGYNKITEQSSHSNKVVGNLLIGGFALLAIRGLIFVLTGFSI